jgi:sucrose-6-phosphate hydrolase SacC (GH32 family)
LPGSVPVICEFNRVAEFFITLLAPEDGAIHLRALRDRTSFELFGNHGAVSLSACTQPGTPQSVVITSEGDNALVRLVEARQLKSAWPE